jgi:hypothetical protein
MKASIKLQALFTQDYLDKNPQIIIDDLVDYLEPESFNPETQKIGNIILVNGVATHEVIDLTPEEIAELNKPIVPESISRMNLKIQLLLRNIEIQEIEDTINSIPDFMFPEVAKKISIIKFNEAVTFDRYNADLNLIATLMGLSQEDLDEIFINGNI